MKTLMTWMALLLLAFNVNSAYAQPDRNIAEYNLNNQGVGLIDGANKALAPGYDPVSVFPEGAETALKGDVQFALVHKGVEYLFATAENMKTFQTNPENLNRLTEVIVRVPWSLVKKFISIQNFLQSLVIEVFSL